MKIICWLNKHPNRQIRFWTIRSLHNGIIYSGSVSRPPEEIFAGITGPAYCFLEWYCPDCNMSWTKEYS